MTPPIPTALRLVTCAPKARVPPPPFGLRSWSSDAPSIAIQILAEGLDASDPAAIAAQIPHASQLPESVLVCVLAEAARGSGLGNWLRRARTISRAARCTALVARGYTRVGGGIDPADGSYDLAWGFSSPC